MEIYDISQEVFGCAVFPGDPSPQREVLAQIGKESVYALTAFSMCAHNGTHVDAPAHFLAEGKTVEELPLASLVGWAFVAEWQGEISEDGARELLSRARRGGAEYGRRILVKGDATLTLAGARVLAESGVLLYGNESQTVGPENAPMAVHLALLGAETVLLEGVRLGHVPEGGYFLSAAPLNLGGAEGAPCRALLVRFDEDGRL